MFVFSNLCVSERSGDLHGLQVTAHLTPQGGLLLEGPVMNADSRDRIELKRVTDFRRGPSKC